LGTDLRRDLTRCRSVIGPYPLAAGASLFIGKTLYRFFQPPLCPGAPPLERGRGPNSGPDWRESVGWKILLPLTGPVSSGDGLRGVARPGR
jgi:hypothetical protein